MSGAKGGGGGGFIYRCRSRGQELGVAFRWFCRFAAPKRDIFLSLVRLCRVRGVIYVFGLGCVGCGGGEAKRA